MYLLIPIETELISQKELLKTSDRLKTLDLSSLSLSVFTIITRKISANDLVSLLSNNLACECSNINSTKLFDVQYVLFVFLTLRKLKRDKRNHYFKKKKISMVF